MSAKLYVIFDGNPTAAGKTEYLVVENEHGQANIGPGWPADDIEWSEHPGYPIGHRYRLGPFYASDGDDDLKEAQAKIAELESTTYCAYCGTTFVLDDKAATLVTEHIHACPDHPMRLLEVKIERLIKAGDAMAYSYSGDSEMAADRAWEEAKR